MVFDFRAAFGGGGSGGGSCSASHRAAASSGSSPTARSRSPSFCAPRLVSGRFLPIGRRVASPCEPDRLDDRRGGRVVLLRGGLVAVLVARGRRVEARALRGLRARLRPSVRPLARDPRVARRHKLVLAALAVYLASPIELVPDFVPVAGELDDAILVALVLRATLRSAGAALVAEQ